MPDPQRQNQKYISPRQPDPEPEYGPDKPGIPVLGDMAAHIVVDPEIQQDIEQQREVKRHKIPPVQIIPQPQLREPLYPEDPYRLDQPVQALKQY